MKKLKNAVIYKENPNSQETNEVMPGVHYLSVTGELTRNRSEAERFTSAAAQKFCSRRSYEWMLI